jgi:hypothetical protein
MTFGITEYNNNDDLRWGCFIGSCIAHQGIACIVSFTLAIASVG